MVHLTVGLHIFVCSEGEEWRRQRQAGVPRVGDSWRSTVAGKLESVEHSVMDSSSQESHSLWGVPQRTFREVSSVQAQQVEVAAGPLESSCLGG